MPDFSISDVHAIEPREPVYSHFLQRWVLDAQPGGVGATVTTEDGHYGVSRLDGEDAWVIDSKWTLRNIPVFANGEGSRCTLLHKIDDAAIVSALDFAADTLREQAEMAAAGHDGTVVG